MKNVTLIALAFCSFVSAFGQSNTPNTATQSFLLFSARSPTLRPLSPGHAFVSFGQTAANEAQVDSTYGFYPCEGCSMVNDDKPGRLVKGFWKNRNQKRLKWLAVSADTQRQALTVAVIEKWHGVRYNLFRRNCVKFISEVAEAQGLNVPKTNRMGIFPKFPQKYIHELSKANPLRTLHLQGISKDGLPIELDENKNEIPDIAELELERP